MKTFRVILFDCQDMWLAQGLDHDVCVQALTRGEAMALFDVTVQHEEVDGLINRIPPAPAVFFARWEDWSSVHNRHSYRDDMQYEFRVVL